MDPLKAAKSAAKQVIGQAKAATTPRTTSLLDKITPGVLGKLPDQGVDRLMAAFMKLNISDPNNSPETQQQLQDAVGQLRQQGVENAEDKVRVAKEALSKAKLFAGAAKIVGVVAAVVLTVAAVSVAAVTFGAAAPLMVGAAAAGVNASLKAGGPEKLGQAAQKFLGMAGRVGQAPTPDQMLRRPGLVPYSSPYPKPEGASSGPAAERMQKLAEMMQGQVEEESAIIKTILESKNKVVESVMKMLQQAAATQTKVMSAGMRN